MTNFNQGGGAPTPNQPYSDDNASSAWVWWIVAIIIVVGVIWAVAARHSRQYATSTRSPALQAPAVNNPTYGTSDMTSGSSVATGNPSSVPSTDRSKQANTMTPGEENAQPAGATISPNLNTNAHQPLIASGGAERPGYGMLSPEASQDARLNGTWISDNRQTQSGPVQDKLVIDTSGASKSVLWTTSGSGPQQQSVQSNAAALSPLNQGESAQFWFGPQNDLHVQLGSNNEEMVFHRAGAGEMNTNAPGRNPPATQGSGT